MGHFRKSVIMAGIAMTAFATSASAIGSKADCEYEGGQVFNTNGATVCVVQIRPAEYRDNEVYDGQQLGVNSCDGEVLNDGLFCKITLVAAPAKPATVLETPTEAPAETSTLGGVLSGASSTATGLSQKVGTGLVKDKLTGGSKGTVGVVKDVVTDEGKKMLDGQKDKLLNKATGE